MKKHILFVDDEQPVLDSLPWMLRSHLNAWDIIRRLRRATRHPDNPVGDHAIRVSCTSRAVAKTWGMDRDSVETLFQAALLHDIGKAGIPDAVLLKRGPLNHDEWEVMKQHCHIGARLIENCRAKNAFCKCRGPGSQVDDESWDNPVLKMGASIALMHHEKWDGTGYPKGLAGEEIPLESSIAAICDVFDAMTSKRPYKDPYPEEHALEILRDGAGTHFAPGVYGAFMDALPEIRSIRKRFADGGNFLLEMKEIEDEANLVC